MILWIISAINIFCHGDDSDGGTDDGDGGDGGGDDSDDDDDGGDGGGDDDDALVATRRGIPLDRKQLLLRLQETTPNPSISLFVYSILFIICVLSLKIYVFYLFSCWKALPIHSWVALCQKIVLFKPKLAQNQPKIHFWGQKADFGPKMSFLGPKSETLCTTMMNANI